MSPRIVRGTIRERTGPLMQEISEKRTSDAGAAALELHDARAVLKYHNVT